MSGRNDIWVVDDDEAIRFVLQRALSRRGFDVECFENVADVRAALEHSHPRALLTDIRLPDADGLSVVDTLQELAIDIPVIAMTAYADLDQAVSAFQKGVFEYLPKPFDLEQVISVVERAITKEDVEVRRPEEQTGNRLLGESQAMQEVFRTIGRLSRSDISVLITGETGSGKEVVARVLHEHSPRAKGPFVAINTAAIPAELLESELFGHEKGSFTGAHSRRVGRFEEAAGGTLFLDEIGDMPLPLQTRLLRVLAEGDYYRVGGRDLLSADARVIAATHQDLEQKIIAGKFREDLYHRLNVIHIGLPPLRERTEDIAILARRFLVQVASELGLEEKRLRPETIKMLETYAWPGNVRQLLNLCRQLCVMAPGDQIFPDDLPADMTSRSVVTGAKAEWTEALRQWATTELVGGKTDLFGRAQDELERVLIDCALDQTAGQRQKAAELLGLGRNTLTRKLQKFDSNRDDAEVPLDQVVGGT
ncbi:MAG: nitrogen regulation protein NR(I) [Xanthomonadales bacterium]|jgi:two-component system nitrogen regulation response regulator GlnG|nr:nitrogen regulation protein NR(I) [Xanthomonadales bacterium]